jgi:hypothetical protein
VAHRPAADAIVEVQQAGLVSDLGARLGGHQTARRGRRDRCLLIAGALTQEAAGADRDDARRRRGSGRIGRGRCSSRRRRGRSRSRARRRGCGARRGRRSRDGAAAGAASTGRGARGGGGVAGVSSDRSLAFTGEGRAFSPRRCALPITALRLTPPSSSAIWEAVEPPSHMRVNLSMRSSVQLIDCPKFECG